MASTWSAGATLARQRLMSTPASFYRKRFAMASMALSP